MPLVRLSTSGSCVWLLGRQQSGQDLGMVLIDVSTLVGFNLELHAGTHKAASQIRILPECVGSG